MASNLAKALDHTINRLESQLAALKSARTALGGGESAGRGPRRRRRLTAAERAAISRRMKAAWKRRKAQK